MIQTFPLVEMVIIVKMSSMAQGHCVIVFIIVIVLLKNVILPMLIMILGILVCLDTQMVMMVFLVLQRISLLLVLV